MHYLELVKGELRGWKYNNCDGGWFSEIKGLENLEDEIKENPNIVLSCLGLAFHTVSLSLSPPSSLNSLSPLLFFPLFFQVLDGSFDTGCHDNSVNTSTLGKLTELTQKYTIKY